MDTVLGLALTPTTIGWVIADGSGRPGSPTLSGDELGVTRGEAGLDAAHLAASASALAARARTLLTDRGYRLHGVGVTWTDEAAVAAALLLESLAEAGFDHVVPVRFSQVAATLPAGIGPPRGARQALARGAALALAPHADLAGPPVEAAATSGEVGDIGSGRAMSLSYAGALTMLAGGAVTFVASVSAALSLQLGTGKDIPDPQPPAHVTVARVAVPAAPHAAAPALAPPAHPAPSEEVPQVAEEPAEFGSLWDAPAVEPDPPGPPGRVPALLDRVREHINGLPGR